MANQPNKMQCTYENYHRFYVIFAQIKCDILLTNLLDDSTMVAISSVRMVRLISPIIDRFWLEMML